LVLRCVLVCCCVLQCFAMRCSAKSHVACAASCVAVCCTVLQCVAVSRRGIAVCVGVLQCVAMRCSATSHVDYHSDRNSLQHSATHQLTATHCNSLHLTAPHCNSLHLLYRIIFVLMILHTKWQPCRTKSRRVVQMPGLEVLK